ncbi:MAG: DUF87 domain-containing protein [Clostridia bacterium]|nr:DUF87 domain-containing protein [Clostridia bacterium]
MSTATAKKKKASAPALATTGRGAAFSITLGTVLLTLGLAFILALSTGSGSYVLQALAKAAQGLSGIFCPLLPLLICWGGLKMLVSARHKVAFRDILLVTCIYLLILSAFTLIARVPEGSGTIPYLDYISKQNYRYFNANQDRYSDFLRQAFSQRTSGAGGLLGMLIAYPLWKVATRIGGFLLAVLLIILLILLLFRINPGEVFRKASDFNERRRIASAQKRQQQEMEANAAQPQPDPACPPQGNNIPMEEMQPGQTIQRQESTYMPPAYYQPAPIYQAAPRVNHPDNGFYAMQPDLRDERYPLHPHQDDGAHSVAWEPRQLDEQIRTDDPIPDIYPEPQSEIPAYPAETGINSPWEEDTYIPPLPEDIPSPEDEDTVIPKDDPDPLPWEEPAIPVSRPIAKESKKTAARKETAPVPPAPVPEKPTASSWATQVRQKQAEIQDFPEHTTAKGDPKPVYTDPVMPITGERIAIQPRKEIKDDPNTRLDGTARPKIHQTSMNLPIVYQAPPMRLLNESKVVSHSDAAKEDERKAQIIEQTLTNFKVDCQVKHITHGPSITRFAIQIAPGILVSKVTSVSDNLALELKAPNVRMETPIQGTSYIGIEVPNTLVSTVSLREVLDSPEMKNSTSPLTVALGKDIAGTPVLCDLSKMPHLLIAGATGSGKSVCINSIVCSLLYRTSPDQVRLIMIDPKQVELNVYNSIPHLLLPVISDPRKASGALAWVVQEMTERYGKFSAQNVRNLAGYNKVNQGTDKVLPNIVVIIDEMADLMEVCRKDVEESIRRLAALARAAGIYMVLATQRPSVDVITGVVKNNIPSRIAFAVSSGTDSRTIIDVNGAENLMGKGDMLYKPTGSLPRRVQGCLVTDDEVTAITDYIASRYETNYDPNIAEHLEAAGKENDADELTAEENEHSGSDLDDLLIQAIEMAVEDGQASTSMLQRRLRVGYARAGRLIDEMEKRGIISHSEGSKPRKTLITREQYYEMFNDD